MKANRRLVLRREALGEFDLQQLTAVGGATVVTRVYTVCRISDYMITPCDCLTELCGSIDVC